MPCGVLDLAPWAGQFGPFVVRNCDIFGETVETEFEHIQNWYRTPRFATDPGIKDLILNYRTPGNERVKAN